MNIDVRVSILAGIPPDICTNMSFALTSAHNKFTPSAKESVMSVKFLVSPLSGTLKNVKEDDASFAHDLLASVSGAVLGDLLQVKDLIVTGVDKQGGAVVLPSDAYSLGEDGKTLTFLPSAFNGLDGGEFVNLSISYGISDGLFVTTNSYTVQVKGANDAPVAGTI